MKSDYYTQEEVTEFVKKWRKGGAEASADAIFGSEHERQVKREHKEWKHRHRQELDAIAFPSYWKIATRAEICGTVISIVVFVTCCLILLGAPR